MANVTWQKLKIRTANGIEQFNVDLKKPETFNRAFRAWQYALETSAGGKAYLNARGISVNTALRAGFGIIEDWEFWDFDAKKTEWAGMRGIIYPKYTLLGAQPAGAKWRNIPPPDAQITPKDEILLANGRTFGRFGNFGADFLMNPQALLNATKPLYVAEGVFDYLTLLEAGKQCVGFGCTTVRLLTEAIVALGKNTNCPPLILTMDNDFLDKEKLAGGANEKSHNKGEKAEGDLRELLRALQNVKTLKEGFFNDCQNERFLEFCRANNAKDLNALWCADKNVFLERCKELEAKILENEKSDFEQYTPAPAPTSTVENVKTEPRKLNLTKGADIPQRFLEKIAFNKKHPPLPTPWAEFNHALGGGWRAGALYVFGGVTGIGKTILSTFFAEYVANPPADSGYTPNDVLIFSLEEDAESVCARLVSAKTAEDGYAFSGISKLEAIDGRDMPRIKTALAGLTTFFEHCNVVSSDESGLGADLDLLPPLLEQYAEQGKHPLVILDYLQILESSQALNTYSDKRSVAEAVVKKIKRIALKFGVPIIALSSLNRDSYTKPIALESFKETGAIEYTADQVWAVQYAGTAEAGTYRQQSTQTAEVKDSRANFWEDVKEQGFGYVELNMLKNRLGASNHLFSFKLYPHAGRLEFVESLQQQLTKVGADKRAERKSKKNKNPELVENPPWDDEPENDDIRAADF